MKVLLTATVQSHIVQFHKPLIGMLHARGCEIHVAARDNLAEKNGLKLDFAEKVFNVPFARSPKSSDNITAYKEIRKIIDEGDYNIIHCNTPMAGIVTRLAARKARRNGTKVIYTAHGFHFYRGSPKMNWIVFYTIERLFAHLADAVITINEEDYLLAERKFSAKVFRIHGAGVDDERYHAVPEEERIHLKHKLGVPRDAFVILCVGELLPNKNQMMVIQAVELLAERYPQLLLLIAGNGRMQEQYEDYIASHHLDYHVRMLGYCTNLEEYQHITDIGVSCSIREGLGFNIIEAMLSENAVIATANRGHNELIKDGQTGYIVEVGDTSRLAACIEELIEDTEKRVRMGAAGKVRAQPYTSSNVIAELEQIYEDVLNG